MGDNKQSISLLVDNILIELVIYGDNSGKETVFKIDESEASANGEAILQLIEGNFYEFQLTEGYSIEESEIVTPSRLNTNSGRLTPNIYVGTANLTVLKSATKEKCGIFKIEVQSVKTTYRKDYRLMLEEITEKCTDLLMQHSSPVTQNFEVDFNADSKTIYQRFAFIKSILDSDEFTDAVHKILTAPVTKWKDSEIHKDVRAIKKVGGSVAKQISALGNRIDLPIGNALRRMIASVPARITITDKKETVDTPENRFIKFGLTAFKSFCGDFIIKLNDGSRLRQEAVQLEEKLEQYLSHSVFKEIGEARMLPLNSPVLQRKEGYREVLRVWLMFDLAARLIWHGGDDIYSGGKRDVAVLYEYWLFFKLLDIVRDVFKINPESVEHLIEKTNDGLGLKLRQGKFLPVQGLYQAGTRKLHVDFSYNKTFMGSSEYPRGGSWTRNLRPDYTLSVWPFGISQVKAEEEELIVHIHFDAKYKVENLQAIFGENEDLDEEKTEQKKGTFKRADILKMHTYRDAIRRTAGAYVLYPGSKSDNKKGFHELLPGLGAFAIRPSKFNNGSEELKIFLNEVVQHFMNRASQREKMSFKTYETHKDDDINEVNELLPETFGANRSLLPDETHVLVAYYKNEQHLKWILNNKLYNARTGSSRGSLRLSPKETGAKYLLLHGLGEMKTGKLFKLNESGPRIFSKQVMINKKYNNPSQEFYLVYEIQGKSEPEFHNMLWDIGRLHDSKKGRGAALPFSVSMTELMKSKIAQ